MHEASLAEGLLKIAVQSIEDYNTAHPGEPACCIASLRLGLGLLSCVEIETFKGCFELLAEGTVAEGARLDMQIQPLDCRCEDCGATFALTKRHFACPQCGGDRLTFTGGHGLVLLSLEAGKKD